jgi:hypothetical protein
MFEIIQGYMYLFACKLAYNIIYIISVCQIKYKNGVKYVSLIKNKWFSTPDQCDTNNLRKEKLVWIKHGKEIRWTDPSMLINMASHHTIENTGQIMLDKNTNMMYIYRAGEPVSNNHLFLCNGDKLEKRNNEIFCENTSYTFISVQVIFKKGATGTLNVNLKLPDANYYVVGNALNPDFIKYYATKYGENNISEENIEYDIQVIDGGANFFSVTHKDEIVLMKNSYYIRRANGLTQ